MKPSIIIGIASTIVVLAGLIVVIIVTGHDPSAYLVSITTLIPLVAALFGLDRLTKSTDQIKTNTNGTLSAMRAELATATAKLNAALALLPPAQAAVVATTEPTGSTPVVTADSKPPVL
jgi:hypothetical protein